MTWEDYGFVSDGLSVNAMIIAFLDLRSPVLANQNRDLSKVGSSHSIVFGSVTWPNFLQHGREQRWTSLWHSVACVFSFCGAVSIMAMGNLGGYLFDVWILRPHNHPASGGGGGSQAHGWPYWLKRFLCLSLWAAYIYIAPPVYRPTLIIFSALKHKKSSFSLTMGDIFDILVFFCWSLSAFQTHKKKHVIVKRVQSVLGKMWSRA